MNLERYLESVCARSYIDIHVDGKSRYYGHSLAISRHVRTDKYTVDRVEIKDGILTIHVSMNREQVLEEVIDLVEEFTDITIQWISNGEIGEVYYSGLLVDMSTTHSSKVSHCRVEMIYEENDSLHILIEKDDGE